MDFYVFIFFHHLKNKSLFFSNTNVLISNRSLIIRCIHYTVCSLWQRTWFLWRPGGVCVKTVLSQSESLVASSGSSSSSRSSSNMLASPPHSGAQKNKAWMRQVFAVIFFFLTKFKTNTTFLFCSFFLLGWSFFFTLSQLEDTLNAWFIHSGSSDDQTLDLARSLQSAGLPAAWHCESLRLWSLRPDNLPPVLRPVLPLRTSPVRIMCPLKSSLRLRRGSLLTLCCMLALDFISKQTRSLRSELLAGFIVWLVRCSLVRPTTRVKWRSCLFASFLLFPVGLLKIWLQRVAKTVCKSIISWLSHTNVEGYSTVVVLDCSFKKKNA